MLRYWRFFIFLLRYYLHLPWWRIRFKHFGSRSFIHKGVIITCPERVSIGKHTTLYHRCFIGVGDEGEVSLGDYSHLGVDVYLNASQGCIKIGNHVAVAPKSGIYSYSNSYQPGKPVTECYKVADVTIEDNVLIGAGVVILPGVTVSEGVVVGANSVVTKSIASYTIVAGAPAREIGKRPK